MTHSIGLFSFVVSLLAVPLIHAAETPATPVGAKTGVAASAYAAPELWSEPIRDYLDAGGQKYGAKFNRGIAGLQAFSIGGGEPMLWICYGDANVNMSKLIPIEFRYLTSPDDPAHRAARVLAAPPFTDTPQGGEQRTPFDSGEEQIEPFRLIQGELWHAGVDSNNIDEKWTQAKPGPHRLIEGNVFKLASHENAPAWRKFRSIPGGEHVHDIVGFKGAVYAVGSGSDHRDEWEGGSIFRYVWKSSDGGKSFATALRETYPKPGMGDTRFVRLLPVGNTLYAFGLINPRKEFGTPEPRHVALNDDGFRNLTAEADGPIAGRFVRRTWPLDDSLGLIATRGADQTSGLMLATPEGFRDWSLPTGFRLIDLTAGAKAGEFLLLVDDASAQPRYSVRSVTLDAIRSGASPQTVLGIPENTPNSIALWHGDLFIGTAGGKVLRARKQ